MNGSENRRSGLNKDENPAVAEPSVGKNDRAISLQGFLTRLIWWCVLPLLLLAIGLAGSHIRTLQAERDQDAADRARNLANALDRNLSARIAALQVLAASPLLDDFHRLDEVYRQALGYRESFASHVILADPSMQMLLNTRVPLGTTLPKLPIPKGHAAAPAALATGNPAVGDMFFGPVAEKPLVALAVPVVRQGRTLALLLGIIATNRFQQRLEEVALPEGWALTLFDGKDEAIARRAPPDRADFASPAGPGRFVARMAVAPWSVVLDIPPQTYHSRIVATGATLAAAIFAVTLVSFLGGRLAGRRLGRALATLNRPGLSEAAHPSITEVEGVRSILKEAAAARDVSENALRQSEAKYRNTLDSMLEGCQILDFDWRYRYLNRAAETHNERPNSELLGRTMMECWPGITETRVFALEKSCMEERITYQLDNEFTFPDGHKGWFRLVIQPTAEGIAIYSDDITVHKQTEEAVLRLNEQLEERVRERTAQLEAVNRELEAFSYSVSHDLKAPLRGIDGYSQLLEKDYYDRLDEEGRLFIRNVRASAAQMHELIEDLLNYSRMERRVLQTVSIVLPTLVQSVVARQAAEIKEAGILLNLKVPPVVVHADSEGLAIVLRNLLDNAVKFSRKTPSPAVEIGARKEGDKVIFWVRDNGIGFDMKFHDRIFDTFQRLQRAEDYPGTGIGLALVRKAMQRMGGRAWAESAPGEGATFFLEIPT